MSEQEAMKVKYSIDNGNIKLTSITNFVKCEVCDQNLAINNDGVLLIKTFASMVDFINKKIILRCGKCKSYNTIGFDESTDKKSHCLLSV